MSPCQPLKKFYLSPKKVALKNFPRQHGSSTDFTVTRQDFPERKAVRVENVCIDLEGSLCYENKNTDKYTDQYTETDEDLEDQWSRDRAVLETEEWRNL